MLLSLLIREVYDAHWKRNFTFQKLGQSYSNCLLIKFDRSMSNWAIHGAPQVNRIKVKILGCSNCCKQRVKLLISVMCPLVCLRFAQCFHIDVQSIEVCTTGETNLALSVGLSLPTERPLPVERNVNHVECLDVFWRESSGSGRHERAKDSVLHPFFCLPALDPFLRLYRKNGADQNRCDRKPFANSNCRFFYSHILSVIAKRKIIS